MARPTIHDILEAQRRLSGVIHVTPLLESEALSELAGQPVYLKCENLQRTGAFKIRGAYNKIAQLSEEEQRAGVVAASSGNHAVAVSFVAKLLGIRAVVVLPSDAAPAKQAMCRSLGAELVHVGQPSEERLQKAAELTRTEGLTMVHPFDDNHVIAGHATIGLEILEQLPDVEQVVVQIGGGALTAGVALALRESGFKGHIVGVEPELGPRMTHAWRHGGPIEAINWSPSVADGLRTKKAGDLTYPIVKDFVDALVTVSEAEILDALEVVIHRCKLFVEPSSAVTVAAALTGKLKPKLRTVCLLSGGNSDLHTLSALLKK